MNTCRMDKFNLVTQLNVTKDQANREFYRVMTLLNSDTKMNKKTFSIVKTRVFILSNILCSLGLINEELMMDEAFFKFIHKNNIEG